MITAANKECEKLFRESVATKSKNSGFYLLDFCTHNFFFGLVFFVTI